MSDAATTIDVVRGEFAEETAAAVEELQRASGREAFDVADVVCILRAADGSVLGASAAVATDIELVGGRRFWLYDAALGAGAVGQTDALLSATFTALDGGFDGAAGSPIGLCLLTGDRAEMKRRPEAHWEDPPMLYVGYLDDGRQARVAYFAGARISEGFVDG